MTRSFVAGAYVLAWFLLPMVGAHAQTDKVLVPAENSSDAAADQGASSTSNAALGEDDQQGPIPFDGGQLTITQPEQDGEKVLAYDGKQLASDYDIFFDKIVKIGDVNVALVNVGGGGNVCGPAKVIVWKPKGGEIRTTTVEQDHCGAPPAAIGDDAIYFVPYLQPGETRPALQWSPTGGLTTTGNLTYTPEPGTDWKDADPSKYGNIIDAFHNEAIYKASEALLGKDMPDMTTSLLVGGAAEKMASGAFYATGCVPHDCGGNDGFMAVDPVKHKVYFARRGDNHGPQAWPPLKDWPDDIRKAFDDALGN